MRLSFAPAFLLLAAATTPAHLASQQTATPTAARADAVGNGFSAERLARLDSALQREVDAQRIAGAVALVLRDGQPVYERAVGWADREGNRRMTTDAIFRIASQTKALTSVAIMQLVEEGKLALGDPVSRFIPAFARTTVGTRSDTGLVVTPARRAITIKDLLTHTAGISYGTDAHVAQRYAAQGLGPEAGWGWYTADKDEPVCETMARLPLAPFVAQPGDAYVYGYNTDILGCVVEKASGVPLDEYVRARITAPLGMTDTHFFLPREQAPRLTAVYAAGADGKVARAAAGARGQGHYVEGPRRSFSGGAGLLSTARDYARFLQALLNGGALDGARILGPKTVDVMTANQVGTLFSRDGLGFGLGFQTTDRLGADGLASVGSYGWGGAYATTYKVDPKERLVMVLMTQTLPNRSDIGGKFPTLVYQALVEPRAGMAGR
jgi:CubicO group peptidase (beta-lactamase class C family)